jgi:hypothetical protein
VESGHTDPVLRLALKKAARPGDDWKALLSRDPQPEGFYEWLGKRFLNRAPSQELLSTADSIFSAVTQIEQTHAGLRREALPLEKTLTHSRAELAI